MFRLVLLFISVTLFAGAGPLAAQDASTWAQGLAKLKEAGVSSSVLSAYVHTHQPPGPLTSQDLVYLRKIGVSESVLAEILDSSPRLVSNSELFRMYFGKIFYQNRVWDVSGGLPIRLSTILLRDPSVKEPLKVFNDDQTASGIFTWTGLGLIVGGSVWGVVAGSNSSTNTSVNAGIAFGAVGAGVISSMVGFLTHEAARESLWDALFQYNVDLIAASRQGVIP
jgi:hypothetical protein